MNVWLGHTDTTEQTLGWSPHGKGGWESLKNLQKVNQGRNETMANNSWDKAEKTATHEVRKSSTVNTLMEQGGITINSCHCHA